MRAFIITFCLCLGFVASAEPKVETERRPYYVLVPGFFNSLVPGAIHKGQAKPYFSTAVVRTLAAKGDVAIVDGLHPTGTIAQNGETLLGFLRTLEEKNPGRRFSLIGHSAGGLYILHALSSYPSFPADVVVTMATPYGGIDFIDRLAKGMPGLEKLSEFLKFASLKEFRRERMVDVLQRYAVPEGLRWIAIAGEQPPCLLLQCADAKHLSWLLTITQNLTRKPSDGVVSVDSALALGTRVLRSRSGGVHPIERWEHKIFPLEHWEMVEESVLFKLLGVSNTSQIRDLQVSFFSELAESIQSRSEPRVL